MNTTIAKLAKTIGINPDDLLDTMRKHDFPHKGIDDEVTEKDKKKLLLAMRRQRSENKSTEQVVLNRTTTSKLKAAGTHKSIQVETRKRHTYSSLPPSTTSPPDITPPPENVAAHEKSKASTQKSKRVKPTDQPKKQAATEPTAPPAEKKPITKRTAQPPVKKDTDAPPKPTAAEITTSTKKEGDKKLKRPPPPVPSDKKPKPKTGKRSTYRSTDDYGAGDSSHRTSWSMYAHGNNNVVQPVTAASKTKQNPIEVPSKFARHAFVRPTGKVSNEIILPPTIMVSDLAQLLSVKTKKIVTLLTNLGETVDVHQSIEAKIAAVIVEEFGHKAKLRPVPTPGEDIEAALEKNMAGKVAVPRPPVVAIMGHVDHGKTSLLDSICHQNLTEQEAGGITQSIGAYFIHTDKGQITFLDTPGHHSFTAMRARGAQVTDIVVLVVAADDGVMPQTEEAIQHIQAAQVPMIVAVNKIDKPDADPENIRKQMSAKNIVCEEWGGDVLFVNLSAKTGDGVDALLDAILLQAELLELKGYQDVSAQGVIIESGLDTHRGPIVSALVQQGCLKKGDMILVGQEYGKVRALRNDVGTTIDRAGLSIPVEILGLNNPPVAGDQFVVLNDEQQVRRIAQSRKDAAIQAGRSTAQLSVDDIFHSEAADKKRKMNILLRTDNRGSVEAIQQSLTQMNTEEAAVDIVLSGVGAITESDIQLATTMNALVIGFNVQPDTAANKLAIKHKVEVAHYNLIYELLESVQEKLIGITPVKKKELLLGIAEVREVFRSSSFGAIAGCFVREGSILKNKLARVRRDDKIVFDGELESLRQFKADVNNVSSGKECGIGMKKYTDIMVGDHIEIYEMVEQKIR